MKLFCFVFCLALDINLIWNQIFYKNLNFVQEKLYNTTDTNKRIQHDRLHFGLCTRPLFFFVCNNKTKGLRVHILVSKGQIKSKEAWACCRFSQKRMNKFVLFAVKSKKANKRNSFVCFLGESTARQSASDFIRPLIHRELV